MLRMRDFLERSAQSSHFSIAVEKPVLDMQEAGHHYLLTSPQRPLCYAARIFAMRDLADVRLAAFLPDAVIRN